MPIAICGVSEVPAYAAIPLDHIISIRDHTQMAPDIRAFKTNFTLHSFVFDDTGDSGNQRACTIETIRRLLAIYGQTTIDQSILFHCFAGVSRSSAAAFIWLVSKGISYAEAYQDIVTVRGPFVAPNQLMIKWADQLMGHDGKMTTFMSAELGRRAEERHNYFSSHSSTI